MPRPLLVQRLVPCATTACAAAVHRHIRGCPAAVAASLPVAARAATALAVAARAAAVAPSAATGAGGAFSLTRQPLI